MLTIGLGLNSSQAKSQKFKPHLPRYTINNPTTDRILINFRFLAKV